MLDGYLCQVCGGHMAGWSGIALHEPRVLAYDDDRHYITIAACWGCRDLLAKAFKTENPRYQEMYSKFLQEVLGDFRQFRDGVVNPQVLG